MYSTLLNARRFSWAIFTSLLLRTVSSLAQSSYGDYPAQTKSVTAQDPTAGTNLATGTIAPVIPLLSLSARSYTVPVSLSYTAGAGIKVNDVASDVGLGWNLNAGGYIVREVKDQPDDARDGWLNNTTTGYSILRPGIIVDNLISQNVSDPNERRRSLNPFKSEEITFDSEPDIYTLVLPTGSLQFVFDNAATPVLLRAQNIKIIPNISTTNTFSDYLRSWTVITEDGTQYSFGGGDYTENMDIRTNTGSPTSNSNTITTTYKYKWLLEKIVTAQGETINFNYRPASSYTVAYNNEIRHDYIYTRYENATGYNSGIFFKTDDPFIRDTYQYPNIGDKTQSNSFTWKRRYKISTKITYHPRQLATISTVLGRIQFDYQLASRQDIDGNIGALRTVGLFNYNNDKVQQFELTQSYSYAYPINGKPLPGGVTIADQYHLMLNAIVETTQGCLPINKYRFTYNGTPFFRNSAAQDYWGYLNGDHWSDTIAVGIFQSPSVQTNPVYYLPGRDRSPNETLAQALILQQITLPTGGSTEYQYQLHDIGSTASPNKIGGLRIWKIIQHDGVSASNDITTEYQYGKENNNTVSSATYGELGVFAKLQFVHGSRNPDDVPKSPYPEKVWQPTCPFNGIDYYYALRSVTSMVEVPADYVTYSCVTLVNGDGSKIRHTFTGWNDEQGRDYIDPISYQFDSGRRCANDPLSGASRGLFLPAVQNSFNLAPVPKRTSRVGGRGLLLSKVELTAQNQPVHKQVLFYDFTQPPVKTVTALIVTGDLDAFGFTQGYDYYQAHFYKHFSTWYPLVRTVETTYDQLQPGNENKKLITTTELSYQNLYVARQTSFNSQEPSQKYVQTVTRPLDFGDDVQYSTTTPSLLKKKYMLAVPVEQRTSLITYQANQTRNFSFEQGLSGWTTAGDQTIYAETYGGGHNGTATHGTHYGTSGNYSTYTYQVITGLSNGLYTLRGWAKSGGGQSVARMVARNYGGAEQQALITATPNAQFGDWTLLELRDLNVTNGQCEIGFQSTAGPYQWLYFDDVELAKQVETTQQAAFTEYKDWGNNLILPWQSYASPVNLTDFSPVKTSIVFGNTWGLKKDSRYILTNTITSYSAEGNPVNSIDRAGISTGTIWGYNKSVPIATVSNGTVSLGTENDALPCTAGYTSFEEDIDPDLWAVGVPFANEAKTGKRSVQLSSNGYAYGPGRYFTIPPEQQHGKYVYSCWAKIPKNEAGNASFLLVTIVKENRAQTWLSNSNGAVAWYGTGTSVPAGQDWRYCEQILDFENPTLRSMLPAGKAVLVQCYPYINSGNTVLLDEVRFRRVGVPMQTTTYTPLVGQTSSTDLNNRSSYFEYDDAQQLRLVRDEDRNIVRRTQTHPQGAAMELSAGFNTSAPVVTANCPVTFTASSTCAANTTYHWDFGDGGTPSKGVTATHAFTAAGTYPVTLVVANTAYNPSRQTQYVTVRTSLSIESITVDGSTAVDLCKNPTPEPVTLSVVLPQSCQPRSLTYRWESRSQYSGWSFVGSGSTYSYSFSQGTYYVRCTVSENGQSVTSGETAFTATAGNDPRNPCVQLQSKTGPTPSAVQGARFKASK